MKGILAHPFIKGSAVMFAGTMLANVLAYFYHLVVGRMLGPAGDGELAAILSIFYILNSPSIVIQNILVRFFSQLKAKKDFGQAKRLFLRITRLISIALILLGVILLPFVSGIASFLQIADRMYLVWLYLMFASFVFGIVNVSVLQAFQQFAAIALINPLSGVLRLGLGTVGAFFGVGWTLVSGVVAGFMGYAAMFFPLKGLLAQKERTITLSPVSTLYYSIPTFIAVFTITALYSQDVVLVKHFFGAEEAGIYSSLSVLGKIIFFASSSLGVVAFPMLAERKELKKPYGSIVAVSLLGVAAVSFGITLFYFLFPSFVVSMLFGSAFAKAGGLLAAFGLFISFFTLSYLFTSMYLALGKTGVWVFTALAAIAQALAITVSHATLSAVIWNNTLIAGGLFATLLLYYPYATRRT